MAEVIDGEADIDEATVSGRYQGQLAYARMVSAQGGMGRLFNVEVVKREEFDAYLQDKEAQGDVSERPLLGGAEADTQAGLAELEEGESE